MAEGGKNHEEQPIMEPGVENNTGAKGKLTTQIINVDGPSNSTILGNCNVIGIVNGNVGTQNDHRNHLLEFTKRNVRDETEGMIHIFLVDNLVEKLQGGQKWITITGNAGDGKTTLAYLVLKALMNINKKEVYVIKTPEDYHHISMIKEDRVIMLNDIFGAFTFDPISLSLWGTLVRDILDSHERSQEPLTRVLLVSRKNVLQDAKDHLERYGELISAKSVDLSSIRVEKDRYKILNYHMQAKGVPESYRTKLEAARMHTPHGFPLCCKMYAGLRAGGQNITLLEFFKTPLKFLDATTRLLFKSGCEDLFISLIENDGVFNINSVSDGRKRRFLRETAAKQTGSYLKKTAGGKWEFTHPSVYESVLSVLAELDPLLVVKHASLSVILQKVRFKSTTNETSTCYICLEQEDDVMNALVGRFIPEICEKGCYTIFTHDISKDITFCERLVKEIVKRKRGTTPCINLKGTCGLTMLLRAAYSRNYTAMRVLVDFGADINIVDGHCGLTVTAILCTHQNVDVDLLKLFINKSSEILNDDPNMKFFRYFFLCQSKTVKPEIVQCLIKSGVDVDSVDDKGLTPLNYLCRYKKANVKTLECLIKSGADVNFPDESSYTPLNYLLFHRRENAEKGNTPLYFSSFDSKENVELTHLLINGGADVNYEDIKGRTILYYLFQNRNSTDTLQVMIKSGVDINKIDKEGKTPINYLFGCGSENTETLHLLISSGTDIKHVDGKGKTLLHYLCKSRILRVESLQLLINSGADVNLRDKNRKTALHYICENPMTEHDIEPIHALIKCRADVNVMDNNWKTPLHNLCRSLGSGVNFKSIRTLVEGGANVNMSDLEGKTALHFICKNRMLEFVLHGERDKHIHYLRGNLLEKVKVDTIKELIKGGAICNVIDEERKTPLHYLCENQMGTFYEMALQELIKGGAVINCMDKDGKTPLHFLCGNLQIYDTFKPPFDMFRKSNTVELKLLINNGAKVNPVDVEGRTPMDYLRGTEKQLLDALLVTGNSEALEYLSGVVSKHTKD